MDILDQITAAVDGRCACGCGAAVTDDSPSAWFAGEKCQIRWQRQQRGEPEPVDPDDMPVIPAPAAPTTALQQLHQAGWRAAAGAAPVLWLRTCRDCGRHATPVDGQQIPAQTFDPATDTYPLPPVPEPEPCNICPHCHAVHPGPYMYALWRRGPLGAGYALLLLAGARYVVEGITGDAARHPQHLANAWRHAERTLLRDLAPRCEHTAGCIEPARERCELRAPVQWEGRWHAPGSALLLCGRHGAEFRHHCRTYLDPVLGPMPEPYRGELLDWVRV